MAESEIRVAIRSRPLLKGEAQFSDALSFESDDTVTVQNKPFRFDYIFRPGVTNEAVYKAVVADKIPHLFEGYNVTILAYGPTGSGKTYTMGTDYNPKTASKSDLGIIPRGISEIFKIIESRENSANFLVKVSFLEVYGDDINDLLQNKKTTCNLRDDGENVRVVNLTEVTVKSVEEAFVPLEKGSAARHTSATAKNIKSSRSHAIFSVYVEQTDKKTADFKRSKFQLVDLAGSERISTSKTYGLQQKEGININLGLLSLAKVITNLAKEEKHIPYRESKLTRLLQDSLGGNSHTVMIACINPSSANSEETLNTLRYANNTRSIKNRPVINVDPPEVQIEKLKKKVEELHTALYEFQSGNFSTNSMSCESGDAKVSKVESLQVELQNALSRITSLVDKTAEMEDKCRNTFDGIQILYGKIGLFVTEMTTRVAEDPRLKDLLGKLEEIQSHCFDLLNSANVTNIEFDDSEESVFLKPTSELDLQALEEMTDKQKAHHENLENIDRTLTIKYDQVKNMENFFKNYEANVNEDYINTLMSQIQDLVQEKNKLEEDLKVSEERVRSENQQKITNYEKQISHLKVELRNKKSVLQAKEENLLKINQCKAEIMRLKTTKVQLLKQMKQDAKDHLQKQREKDKEVAKLVKETRRRDLELSKVKNKFEREVSVLKQKVDRLTAAKKREVKKIGKNVIAKLRLSTPAENVEEWIIEELKTRVDNELLKRHGEALQKESDSLKDQIKSMVELSDPVGEGTSTGPDVNSHNALIEILDKRIAEIKESAKDEIGKSPLLESLNSMGQAKSALEALFKKCVSEAVEAEMLQIKYQEQVMKEQSNDKLHQEKVKSLEHDIEKLNQKIKFKKIDHEREISSLKFEYENKIMLMLTNFQEAMKSAASSGTDQALIEQIEAQEKEIQRLQHVNQDYDHKCKEVMMLQNQLFQAKKGKKATWLGNITQQSVVQSSSSTSYDDKSVSMLDEYLSSPNESFESDKKDPDWRLTPAYKRRDVIKSRREARKRRFADEQAQDTVISDTSSDLHSSLPKKKNAPICKCRTDCKSMRCLCQKNGAKCSVHCGCIKTKCANVEKVYEATHISEDIIEIDPENKSFAD